MKLKLTLTIAIAACIGALSLMLSGSQVSAQAPSGTVPVPVAQQPIIRNVDYVVAQGASVGELVVRVKALQARGYFCQGGMATAISQNGSGYLYQPMVR